MSDQHKTILITGATDGIGKSTAQMLAKEGHHILLHGRNEQKLQKVADEIRNATGSDKVEQYIADFASLQEVQKLTAQVSNNHLSLDILINNAGVAFVDERQVTGDGFELCFQINYLAPFLLTNLLLSSLENASEARIVNVSSGAQHAIDFDDPNLEKSYSSGKAYAQSKLALIMFTFSLAEKLQGKHITANALHPGTYLRTKISPMGEPEDGAEAVRYLAVSPEQEGISGKYFNQKKEATAAGQAYDAQAREKLWKLSEDLTELKAVGSPKDSC